MKRCPQCDFIYLDTDSTCDLDGSALVIVDERTLSFGPTDGSKILPRVETARASRRTLTAVLLACLIVGVLLFSAYLKIGRSREQIHSLATRSETLPADPTAVGSPEPSVTSTPVPSPSPTVKTNVSSAGATRGAISKSPVSTSATGTTSHARIRLLNGAAIEADEVWRTKEGIWYRRSGLVTFLKANQVRSIEVLPAK